MTRAKLALAAAAFTAATIGTLSVVVTPHQQAAPAPLALTNTILHGNPSGPPSWSQVDLANDVTGNLPISAFPGTADSGNFLSGDGTWRILFNSNYLSRSTSTSCSTSAVNYLPVQGAQACTATEANYAQLSNHSGVYYLLQCQVSTAPGSGKSWTFTLRNGTVSDTGLTCAISNTNTGCFDDVHTFVDTGGALVDYKITPAGTPASSSMHVCSILKRATN